MTGAKDISLGVVIPAFGHPKFLAEAIVSACEQETQHPVLVVVVDDGCRFEETGAVVAPLLAKYGGRLFYVRQQNTRLPGARNTGIRFLMTLEPNLAAIFFLDADNRLSPASLQTFWHTLKDNPDKAWAYPDISFFGLVAAEEGFDTRETARRYSKLKHLVSNVSEAGSMVRTDVFRKGVYYDESMTSGFEDWEFWLSALDAGFEGVHTPHAGFMYRVRPESMLSESQRQVDMLVDTIRCKHPALFAPAHILKLEQAEAPAFAVFVPEDKTILLTGDFASEGEIVSISEFRTRFQAWAYNYHEHFFPTHIMVVPKAVLALLQQQHVFMRWFLWQVRERAQTKQCFSLGQHHCPDLKFLPYGYEEQDEVADIFCVKTELLWACAHDPEAHRRIERAPYWAHLLLPFISVDFVGACKNRPATSLETTFESLIASLLPLPVTMTHANKIFSGPHAQTVREILIPELCAVEGREPFPANTGKGRTLVVVPAEHLNHPLKRSRMLDILGALQREDEELIMLLEHCGDIVLQNYTSSGLPGLVTDIIPMDIQPHDLGNTMYLGAPFQKTLGKDTFDDVAIAARTCQRMISIGVTASVEVFGAAKRFGTKGYVLLDPVFGALSPQDKAKLLAYEHAVAHVITDTQSVDITAQGMPTEKLMTPAKFFC